MATCKISPVTVGPSRTPDPEVVREAEAAKSVGPTAEDVVRSLRLIARSDRPHMHKYLKMIRRYAFLLPGGDQPLEGT